MLQNGTLNVLQLIYAYIIFRINLLNILISVKVDFYLNRFLRE